MPRDPGEAPARNVDIDDEQRWRLKLRSVVEVESRFNDRRKDAVFLSWRFAVYGLTATTPVLTDSGDVFELWVPSNDATYRNPDTGKMGGAREMANTLVGRELTDEEVRDMNANGIEGWSDALVGKTLIADLEWTQTDNGYDRLKLLRKRADKDGPRQPAAAPPEPRAPAPTAAETPAERRARLVRELEGIDGN